MRSTLIAALCASLCAAPTAVLAQDEDDWEFQHEPSLNQMVAAVRYDAGVAIVVQCRDRALSAALVGMPPVTERFELKATRADGRIDTQAWVPGAGPGVFLSAVPARDIRFMRGGGLYSVRTEEGAARALRTDFDLPTQSANLDRVLTACGWALTDERDQLERADGSVSLSAANGAPSRRPRNPSRPRASNAGRPARPEPGPPPLPIAEGQISCIIRDLRLTECRADHAPSPAESARARRLGRLEGAQVDAPEGAAVEGRLMFFSGPVIVVTREELIG